MRDAEQVHDDVLFVACTRPAIVAIPWVGGLPHAAFYANMVGSFMMGVWFGPLFWLACIPAHMLMRVACNADPNFVRVWHLWLRTRLGCLGPHFGISHFLPKSTRPYAREEEVLHG